LRTGGFKGLASEALPPLQVRSVKRLAPRAMMPPLLRIVPQEPLLG